MKLPGAGGLPAAGGVEEGRAAVRNKPKGEAAHAPSFFMNPRGRLAYWIMKAVAGVAGEGPALWGEKLHPVWGSKNCLELPWLQPPDGIALFLFCCPDTAMSFCGFFLFGGGGRTMVTVTII